VNSGPSLSLPQEDDGWGDKFVINNSRNKKIVRFTFWNCGGFPVFSDQPKNHLIRSIIDHTKADVSAFAEVNLSWKNLHPKDRIRERTWGWFPSIHTTCSYARTFPTTSAALTGGTAMISTNEVINHVMESTSDDMGRWCSTKFRGKGNKAIRFISAYRCVKNIHGPLSVWNQQRYLLDLSHNNTDPIEKFDADLSAFIRECLDGGESIVLGIDANADTRTGPFPSMMSDLGLINIFVSKFGMHIPPTYSRGSLPIDSIYVSPSFSSCRAGFLKVYFDHRVLWIDIPQEQAFGQRLHQSFQTKPSRLSLQDPRIVTKYLSILENYMNEHAVLLRLETLQRTMQSRCSAKELNEYNDIDNIRTKGILLANKKCRKLRMGMVPFSPRLVVMWQKMKAWQLVIRKRCGAKIDSKYLKRVHFFGI
jgi:hypothetical protein